MAAPPRPGDDPWAEVERERTRLLRSLDMGEGCPASWVPLGVVLLVVIGILLLAWWPAQ